MSILVTVRIDADPAVVEQVEKDHPEVLEEIMAVAKGYMTSHRRVTRAGAVLDLDEYASEADYEAFIDEARPAIERYGQLIGAAPRDEVWTV